VLSVATLSLTTHQRDALDSAADLKGRLVTFATTPPYERLLRQQLRSLDRSNHSEKDLAILAVEALLFEFEYDDGGTVLDRFSARQQLTPDERSLIGQWDDSVFGVFEVTDRAKDVLLLHNLLDELDYVAFASMGPDSILPIAPDTFLITRLLPVGDAWLLSGIQVVLPPESRDEVAESVAKQALQNPELVLRNPAKLARAIELTTASHASFIDCFGTDRVVVPAQQALTQYHRFLDHHHARLAPPSDTVVRDHAALTQGWEQKFAHYETMAIWHRPDTGIWFFGDYQLARNAFVDPPRSAPPECLDTLRSYLHDDTIPPWVIEELRAEFPDVADLAIAHALGRPDFQWQTDGTRLMRKHKPAFYSRHAGLSTTVPLPSIARRDTP
jgi:hypothetical protein